MRGINGAFQGIFLVQRNIIVFRGLGSHCLTGLRNMVVNVDAEIELIAGIQIIIKILFEMIVGDRRRNPDIVSVTGELRIVIVVAVDQGGIGKQLVIEDMVPAEGGRRVAPVDAGAAFNVQYILSEITRQKNTIFFIQLVISFQVDIIEIQYAVFEVGIGGQSGECIHVGSPGADHKRALVLYDRSFQVKAGSDQADASAYAGFLIVPIIHFNVLDGSQPAAIIGRHTTLIDSDVFNGIRVEDGKET